MDRVIHKHQIVGPDQAQMVVMHLSKEARIISLQFQRGVPTLWIEMPIEDVEAGHFHPYLRHLIWVATGRMIQEHWQHVGTLLFQEGALVFHLYETTRR